MLRLLAVLPLVLSFQSDPSIDATVRPGYDSITANDLRAHLGFLASPELEGRETTYRGQKVAAQYIAAVFRKLGLKAVGDDNTYFQHFDLEVIRPSERSTISVVSGTASTSFRMLKDFLSIQTRDTVLSGEVVFVGFTDVQPDSATMAMAEGRIALALGRVPRDQREPRRLSATNIPRSIATIVVTDEFNLGTIDQLVQRAGSFLTKGNMRLPGSAGRQGSGQMFTTVSSEVGDAILKASGRTTKQLRESAEPVMPFAIPGTKVTLDLKIDKEVKQTENVVGFLQGSDPKLRDEVVVMTAHYDHVGIGSDGAIYHGADDDGSGTSVILELAEAFVHNPVKPKRSILFMTVSGEEKGLLGSRYYVEKPLFPLDKTAANINIDMVGRIDKKYEAMDSTTNYVYVIGSDKISTELDSLLQVSNKQSENFILDYQFNDDNDPNQFYRRSDHYNFARNGIPIVFFFTGVHDDYHRPGDTVDKILFDRMARIGRLIYTLGWKAAEFPRPFRKDGKPSVYQ
jgi:Zn-dependent M28 family amino/carboxypeptidase